MIKLNKTYKSGFTLIELLIVIAILGTLAVVILVALNPAQQLARTRDAGRQSTVAQLGRAVEALATNNNGLYLAPSATWITGLVSGGEVSTVPSAPATTLSANCGVNAQNGICYNTYNGNLRAIVYMRAESQSTLARCPDGNTIAYFVYSSVNGGTGILCTAGGEPGDPGAAGYSGANWIRP